MAKKKSSFEKAQAAVLSAIRRFEEAVKEMVGVQEDASPGRTKTRTRKSKKRKTSKRGR